MKIVSYNIRKAFGLDWKRNPKRIEDILLEIDADIIILQEADKRFFSKDGLLNINRLKEKGDYQLYNLSLNRKSHGWHGNVILSRNYNIIHEKRIKIPTFEPRGAISITIEEPQIEIIGTHLSLFKKYRNKQLNYLEKYTNNSSSKYTLIAGDFNEWGDIKNFKDTGTIVSPGYTFHTKKPVASLDKFILVGNIIYDNAYIYQNNMTKVASDHLPIVIEITI